MDGKSPKALFIKRNVIYMIPIGTILIIYAIVLGSGFVWMQVNGNSMVPTLRDGEMTLARRIGNEDLSYGIYALENPEGDNHIVKRLIGLPGDTVELINGDTYRNGILIMERISNSWDQQTFTVPEGCYLFLGDNRADSFDARYWEDPYIGRDGIIAVLLD